MCAEQAPLAKESLQTGELQLLADEATATVSTRCRWTSKHGHGALHGLQTGHPQHLPHVSRRITRGREERGLIPSTAVQSRPEPPLRTPTGLHQPSPPTYTHRGLSHQLPRETLGHTPVCSITQLTPPVVCMHWLRWLHCTHTCAPHTQSSHAQGSHMHTPRPPILTLGCHHRCPPETD